MNYFVYAWILLGLLSLVLLGIYPKGICLYSAIGAFAAAMVALYNAPLGFQAVTAINTGLFSLSITETGIKNRFWVLIILSEFVFFCLYYCRI